MESSSNAAVVAELTLLQELTSKLNAHLDPSQIELCRLTQEINFSVEKAICTAKSSNDAQPTPSDSRCKHEFIDKELHMYKKRKIPPKSTMHVSVSTAGVAEAPPHDGHSWRKYGQKDILGAKHPRAYYRCTHRKTKGCAAMKQVQRSDDNPSILDINYRGTHTCSHLPQQTALRSGFHESQQSLLDQQISSGQHYGFQTNLNVLKSENPDNSANQDPTSLFNFPSTPIDGKKLENDLFCLSSVLMSPTTSGSNCLPWTPCEMSSLGDPELAEIISAATSANDSPIMDVEFMLEYGEMDPGIHFDTSIFFA